ncbi:MAG: hypothetical protein L6R39_007751 [Caloplaca ligustica]|nr:MAG: hypothetical protein L6R39_007751 [Caloplaca ligustica]
MRPLPLALTILPLVANAYKGDMTHYTPGLGSCGYYTDPSKNEPVVALSREIMANGPNPNNNPKCGTKINIYNERTKKTHQATIVDTCQACQRQDIDVNEKLFYAVAPNGDGRVHGIAWGGSAVGGFAGMEEDEENRMVEQGDVVELVEQTLRGSMRFREKETFMQGCGKVVSKIREMNLRFWGY